MTFYRLIIRTSAVEIVVKDTTDSPKSVSYLDLYIEYDINGNLRSRIRKWTLSGGCARVA